MFSLRTLLIAVAIAAVGIVGLSTRNAWWTSIMLTITTVVISTALAVAIFGRSSTKVTAGSFAVFSGVYAIIAFSQLFPVVGRSLFPARVISYTWQSLDISKPAPDPNTFTTEYEGETDEESVMAPFLGMGKSGETRAFYYEMQSFYLVGHCLWTLAFGVLGALIGRYLERNPQ